jgi:hypothetical protein
MIGRCRLLPAAFLVLTTAHEASVAQEMGTLPDDLKTLCRRYLAQFGSERIMRHSTRLPVWNAQRQPSHMPMTQQQRQTAHVAVGKVGEKHRLAVLPPDGAAALLPRPSSGSTPRRAFVIIDDTPSAEQRERRFAPAFRHPPEVAAGRAAEALRAEGGVGAIWFLHRAV